MASSAANQGLNPRLRTDAHRNARTASSNPFLPFLLPGDAFFLGGDFVAETTGTHRLRLIWPRAFLVAMGVWQTALRVPAEGVLPIFLWADMGRFNFVMVLAGAGSMTRIRCGGDVWITL